MGLNTRGRGRGRGNDANFQIKGRPNVEMMGQGQMFRPGPVGMIGPPIGFHPQPPFGGPPNFGRPSGFNFSSLRPAFGKFPQNKFRRKFPPKNNSPPVLEIDLSKPWVTEEIKNEDTKKQQLLQMWKDTNTDEDWSNYKTQKLTVQSLYDKAKAEYALSHPNQAVLWENISNTRNYYCETCDKSFRTDDDLYLHNSEHETCGRDGCEFTAHPKIISKHIKMQHLSGLYNRIGKLYSEEDIAKWIEERKKRYPTRKVVEEKKILEEEKISRGERIKDKDSKFSKKFHNRKERKVFEKKTKKNNRNRRAKKNNNSLVVSKCIEEEAPALRKGVSAFLGIKSEDNKEPEIPEKKDLNISDEEWESEDKIITPSKPLLSNSLAILAEFYDSEEENQNEKCDNETKTDAMSDDEGSGPEEVATITSKNLVTNDNSNKEKCSLKRRLSDKKQNQENKKRNNCTEVKRDLTLLEKLLKNEIRHERNVILQCVHYVVKNNFFKT